MALDSSPSTRPSLPFAGSKNTSKAKAAAFCLTSAPPASLQTASFYFPSAPSLSPV